MGIQTVYNRYELKYLLIQEQKEKVLCAMEPIWLWTNTENQDSESLFWYRQFFTCPLIHWGSNIYGEVPFVQLYSGNAQKGCLCVTGPKRNADIQGDELFSEVLRGKCIRQYFFLMKRRLLLQCWFGLSCNHGWYWFVQGGRFFCGKRCVRSTAFAIGIGLIADRGYLGYAALLNLIMCAALTSRADCGIIQ